MIIVSFMSLENYSASLSFIVSSLKALVTVMTAESLQDLNGIFSCNELITVANI